MPGKSASSQYWRRFRNFIIIFIGLLPLYIFRSQLDLLTEATFAIIWPTPYLLVILSFGLIKLVVAGGLLGGLFVSRYRKNVAVLSRIPGWTMGVIAVTVLLLLTYDVQVIVSVGKPLWLHQFGEPTQAIVIDDQIVATGNQSTRYITYEFEALQNGTRQNIIGKQETPFLHQGIVENSTVKIHYLASNPNVSRLDDVFMIASDLIRPLFVDVLILVSTLYLALVLGVAIAIRTLLGKIK